MSRKQIIAISIAVVVIVAGIVILSTGFKPAIITNNNQTPENAIQKSATRAEVPKNIKIPEMGEQAETGVAVPVSVTDAAPGVSAKLRTFNIKAENGLFDPSTIIVKIGDTVHVNFTAVGKTYDITFPDYGMKQTAKAGETKILEFQAVSEGKFTYYCDSCGGIDSKSIGYMIIAP